MLPFGDIEPDDLLQGLLGIKPARSQYAKHNKNKTSYPRKLLHKPIISLLRISNTQDQTHIC
jgi:hypothetical protein